MTRSRHADNRSILAGRAAAYVPGPRGVENAPLQDLSALVGAGSVWSTARDLHRFVEAIVSGRLGQGPRLSFVRQGRLDFNGRTGGFKAWALYDSVTRTEAIFAGNVATGAPDWLKRDILRLAAGEAAKPPVRPNLHATTAPCEAWRAPTGASRGWTGRRGARPTRRQGWSTAAARR